MPRPLNQYEGEVIAAAVTAFFSFLTGLITRAIEKGKMRRAQKREVEAARKEVPPGYVPADTTTTK